MVCTTQNAEEGGNESNGWLVGDEQKYIRYSMRPYGDPISPSFSRRMLCIWAFGTGSILLDNLTGLK